MTVDEMVKIAELTLILGFEISYVTMDAIMDKYECEVTVVTLADGNGFVDRMAYDEMPFQHTIKRLESMIE